MPGMEGMIAVIIVDYHCEALTRQALSSMQALGRDDLRFIVVDNGASVDAARLEADFSGLTVVRPGANKGFAGGCNLGMTQAMKEGAAYCLLLNPDTRAETDFVAPLRAVMERYPDVGAASPTVLEDSPDRSVTNGGGVINWWAGSPKGVKGRRLRATGPYVDVPFVTGAAMLIRMEAVRAAGPMDERYFLYFEDSDYCQAIRQAGWTIAYLPDAEVLHATSSVAGRRSRLYLYCFGRNRIRFMRRWGRWYHRVVFALFNGFVRLPATVLLYGVVRRMPGQAAAFVRGYIDGMLGRVGPAPYR